MTIAHHHCLLICALEIFLLTYFLHECPGTTKFDVKQRLPKRSKLGDDF